MYMVKIQGEWLILHPLQKQVKFNSRKWHYWATSYLVPYA